MDIPNWVISQDVGGLIMNYTPRLTDSRQESISRIKMDISMSQDAGSIIVNADLHVLLINSTPKLSIFEIAIVERGDAPLLGHQHVFSWRFIKSLGKRGTAS